VERAGDPCEDVLFFVVIVVCFCCSFFFFFFVSTCVKYAGRMNVSCGGGEVRFEGEGEFIDDSKSHICGLIIWKVYGDDVFCCSLVFLCAIIIQWNKFHEYEEEVSAIYGIKGLALSTS